MAARTRYTRREVAAAVLEDNSVVVFSDRDSTNGESHTKYYSKDGKYYYNKVAVKGIMHTHPSNSLKYSNEDWNTAIQRGDNHVDIITTDAHLYRIYLSDERIAHHRIDANK